MNLNPCLQCSLKNQDKNNATCRNCYKRWAYVNAINNSPGFIPSYTSDTTIAHNVSAMHSVQRLGNEV